MMVWHVQYLLQFYLPIYYSQPIPVKVFVFIVFFSVLSAWQLASSCPGALDLHLSALVAGAQQMNAMFN